MFNHTTFSSLKLLSKPKLLACLGTIIVGVTLPITAPLAATGNSLPALSAKVDQLMNNLVNSRNLPGAAIAVSVNGNLIVSRGYGKADVSTNRPMNADLATNLGSNTKALITGPAVIQLMAEKGLNPATTRLYGPSGVLGNTFAADIQFGSSEHGTPSQWYYQITVQHLLDHKSGLRGGGSYSAAANALNLNFNSLTLKDSHRYVLRDRPLGSKPGQTYKYSNHNFGVLSMIIEKLSGKSYPDYVAQNYLAPWGLDDEIDLRFSPKGSNDAAPHRRVNGNLVAYNPTKDKVPAASGAGAYRASARDVVRLVERLKERHSPAELDRAGWGANTNAAAAQSWQDGKTGRIAHNGRVGGGTARVASTVDGITVAIHTNISDKASSGAMTDLSIKIIRAVRDIDVPGHWDLWADCTLPKAKKGIKAASYHGMTSKEYQCRFNQMTKAGYKLVDVDAFDVEGKPVFTARFNNSNKKFVAFHGLDGSEYQNKWNRLTTKGWRPSVVDSYLDNGRVRYAAIFIKGQPNGIYARHGINKQRWDAEIVPRIKSGWIPTSLSVVRASGKNRYTVVLEKAKSGESYIVRTGLSPEQYQRAFDRQNSLGRRPVLLDGWNSASGPRLSVVFSSKAATPFKARHGLSSNQYQNAFNAFIGQGLAPSTVTGYDVNGKARYAAVWRPF